MGYGQTYQDVGDSRKINTVYNNSTEKPIMVIIRSSEYGIPYVDDIALSVIGLDSETDYSFIVPVGSTYYITGGFSKWVELR